MASPFAVFRKNRKLMLAALTILAMFAFVFLDALNQISGDRTMSNPVAVTSNFGELREANLHDMRSRRLLVMNVLSEAIQASGISANYARPYVEAFFGATSDEALVDSWLMARNAEQLGMIVGKRLINGYLKEVTQDRVRQADFQAAFKRMNVREFQFLSAIREEILAAQLQNMFRYSLLAATPAQRWEYFNRVKEQAVIEVAAVPVAQYLDRVKDPDESELKAFFEENKEKYARPDSPEPGFHEPHRVELQYVKADYEKFLARVSDEDVAAEYENNKATYDQYEKAAAAQTSPEKAETESTKDTKDTQEVEEPNASEQPRASEEKKTPEEPKTPTRNDGKANDSDERETPQQQPTKEESEEPQRKEATGSDDTSPLQRRSPFMLTALQEEKPLESSTAEAESTKDTKDTKEIEEPKAPAEPKTPEKTESNETNAPAQQQTEEKPVAEKAGPSEQIKKIIRHQLAGRYIAEKVFGGVRDQVEQYRSAWSKYDDAIIRGQQAVAPTKLDLEAIAQEAGLTAAATGCIPQYDMQRTECGGSYIENRHPVWTFAFKSLSKYRPEISRDRAGNYYMFWKTAEEKDRVPEFDDPGVRDKVLHAKKMIQARELAIDEAKRLAEEARAAKTSLKQAFAGRPDLPVVVPQPFTWMTFGQVPLGSAPTAAQLSEVEGVDMAGPEFMQVVFDMQPDDFGAAMNTPKTVAYVIHLSALRPSQNVLWSEFQVDDFSKYAPAAVADQRNVQNAWLAALKTSANLKWNPKRAVNLASQRQQPIESDEEY